MRSILAGLRQRWVAPERRTISRWDTARRPGWLSAMIPRRPSAAGTGTIASRSAPRGKYQILGFKTSSRPSSPNWTGGPLFLGAHEEKEMQKRTLGKTGL